MDLFLSFIYNNSKFLKSWQMILFFFWFDADYVKVCMKLIRLSVRYKSKFKKYSPVSILQQFTEDSFLF